MRDYQKLYYQHYFEILPNGMETEITRRACFAPVENPTAANSFKQRWYYDPEAGYAIRLPRNQMGDDLGKRNATELKAAERYQVRKLDHCPVEIDRPVSCAGDGNDIFLEVADDSADILAILEDREQISALISVMNRLAPEDRELWECLANKVRKQDIAVRLGLTLDGVYYREKRLKAILRSNATLKIFYEKD